MKQCPACGSKELYEYKKFYSSWDGTSPELLPYLGGNFFSPAKMRPTVCLDCGHIGLFASEEARMNLKGSEHWKAIRQAR